MDNFVVSQDAVKNFLNNPSMNDQTGITFAYATDPAALSAMIPAPLKLVAPIVVGYVAKMGKPTFGPEYMEQTLYAMVSYDGKMVGAYPFQLLLSGDGAEAGLTVGRDGAGIPKKLADDITLNRDGETASATVTRHGVKLLDLKWQAGAINEPSFMAQFAGMMKPGEPNETMSFFLNYALDQTPDGANHFTDVELLGTQMTSVADAMEPGSIDLKLASSPDDPLASLPVLKPLGGAWYHFATSTMHNTMHLAKVDAATAAPYLIAGRYDRATYED